MKKGHIFKQVSVLMSKMEQISEQNCPLRDNKFVSETANIGFYREKESSGCRHLLC